MPAKRELTMRQLRYLLRLHHAGVSAREIGRLLGVARNAVMYRAGQGRYATKTDKDTGMTLVSRKDVERDVKAMANAA